MHITIQQVSHTFFGKSARHALQNFSVEIDSSQFVAIVGPSGCGKSTLLRLLAGLLKPQSGNLLLDGMPPAAVAAQRRIAWMAQKPALLPWLTARGNLTLANHFRARQAAPHSPEQALAWVGLSEAAHVYPFQLSGGMQQRLALARTLSMDADLWLMDEPFASLDELTRERLTHELLTLWQPRRPTVLWVTHNLHEAVRLAGRVLVISRTPGQLTADFPLNLPYPRQETDPLVQQQVIMLRKALAQ